MAEIIDRDATNGKVYRRRAWGFAVLLVLLGFLVYFSFQVARATLTNSGTSLWVRAPLFTASALMMVFALVVVAGPFRRKLKTGRFFLTPVESAAKQAEYRSLMGAGKPFRPQAKFWAFPLIALSVLAVFGVVAAVASFNPCVGNWNARIPLLILAAVVLFLPGLYAFKSIQRKRKTGSFLPSQEELDKARASCGRPLPLQQRLLLAGLNGSVAILYTWSAFRHHHAGSPEILSPWALAGIWWFVAAIWTWQVFRPPISRCAPPGNDSGIQTLGDLSKT